MRALGFLEVMGYAVALAVMDAACKAADIEIAGVDSINPKTADAPTPVTIQVKFTGEISDVEAACQAAREAAGRLCPDQEAIIHFLTGPDDGVERLANISKIKLS